MEKGLSVSEFSVLRALAEADSPPDQRPIVREGSLSSVLAVCLLCLTGRVLGRRSRS